MDCDRAQGYGVRSSKRPVAHLAFDAAQIAPPTAARDSLLQNLLEYALMQGFPVLRGE